MLALFTRPGTATVLSIMTSCTGLDTDNIMTISVSTSVVHLTWRRQHSDNTNKYWNRLLGLAHRMTIPVNTGVVNQTGHTQYSDNTSQYWHRFLDLTHWCCSSDLTQTVQRQYQSVLTSFTGLDTAQWQYQSMFALFTRPNTDSTATVPVIIHPELDTENTVTTAVNTGVVQQIWHTWYNDNISQLHSLSLFLRWSYAVYGMLKPKNYLTLSLISLMYNSISVVTR